MQEWLRQAEEEHGEEQLEAPSEASLRLRSDEAMAAISALSVRLIGPCNIVQIGALLLKDRACWRGSRCNHGLPEGTADVEHVEAFSPSFS